MGGVSVVKAAYLFVFRPFDMFLALLGKFAYLSSIFNKKP
jgi:hypothetical protein